MIEPLPKLNGMDAIVVIVDQFTKMIQLKVAMTNISSEEIAKIHRDDIWKLHGISRKILSDRGPQFILKFMEEFTKVLGIKRQLLMAYHPQTDGQMERINQVLTALYELSTRQLDGLVSCSVLWQPLNTMSNDLTNE